MQLREKTYTAFDHASENLQKAEVSVPPPGPESRKNLDDMNRVIGVSNYAGLYSITLVEGDNSIIKDADNNTYVDCLTAASSNILGYNNGLEKTYADQARYMQHAGMSYSPNKPAVQLARKLVEVTPGHMDKKVMFGLSGSDACGGAIEAMRKFTGKTGLISFENDYHGTTGLSQPASGFHQKNDGIYNPQPSDFIKHEYPTTRESRDGVLEAIEEDLKTGEVGGVLMEAIQGDAGIIEPAEGFIRKLKELLESYGALLIVDEVQSGMGRTGRWWAIQHENVIPDLLVSAKGLSAGYAPISAIVGRADVLDSLDREEEVFTYTGHAPSAAVASKVLEVIEKGNLANQAARWGNKLIEEFEKIKEEYPSVIKEVRGKGLMLGLKINIEEDEDAARIFAFRGVEKAVYFGYFGEDSDVVRIEPPLVIDEYCIEKIIQVTREVAKEMANGDLPSRTRQKVNRYSVY